MEILRRNSDALAAAFGYVSEQSRLMEDAARAAAEQQRQQAIEAARNQAAERLSAAQDQINAQYERTTDAINDQRDALGDLTGELNSVISTLQSGIRGLGEPLQDVIDLSYERARRQVAAMANASGVPDADALAAAVDTLTGSSVDYESARAESLANAMIRADPREIEKRAESELSVAERQLEALELQTERASAAQERALEQARAQHDAVIAQLEQQSQLAVEQVALATMQAETLQSAADRSAQPGDNVTPLFGEPTQQSQGTGQQELIEELKALREDLRALLTKAAADRREIRDRIERFDLDGISLRDDDDGAELLRTA
jgi:hypothetical protein